MRVFNGVSKPATSDPISVTMRLVEPLLIYQTRYTELNWFENDDSTEESIRPDLYYGQMTETDIKRDTIVSNEDFKYYPYTSPGYPNYEDLDYYTVNERKDIFKNMALELFTKKDIFKSIISDMIDHFMRDSDEHFTETMYGYGVYENPDLNVQIIGHPKSIEYVNAVKSKLDEYIKDNNGNIDGLLYDPSLRFNTDERSKHPFVDRLGNPILIKQPGFSEDKDVIEGFTICIDSLHGNKIEILSYSFDDTSYSGKLRFTYYDHFGLDANDLSGGYGDSLKAFIKNYAVEILPGFHHWFILQHWMGLEAEKQPMPFITRIRFEESFSGTLK